MTTKTIDDLAKKMAENIAEKVMKDVDPDIDRLSKAIILSFKDSLSEQIQSIIKSVASK